MSKVTSFHSTEILALTPTEIEERIEELLVERNRGELQPEGYFYDGIWYPSETQEKASCCFNINHKLELYDHCKTENHLKILAVETLIGSVKNFV
ncbi:hypothetical protein [Natranaerobius thermophilus]|uniref:Uncharacterized protein n=1 Tax=Natranaerobius thermophilus (strain ATCC BAA-1301 / DSM 18059 / JW/NM-WN-LF) TaxID=457570 RepID=B2A5E7_NATTJ|nr:hypothetical protein [Natranaerobius thermophilus]ACB83981.1 hypothetical protein Nther_0385 [Natranaerobius thermophilus JW/NM-WN-LF]